MISYQAACYFRTNKIILPAVVWIFGLIFTYSVKPNGIIASYSVTGILLFVVIAWVSYSYINSFDEVQEKLLILEANELTFYHTVVMFLFCIGCILALSAVGVPFLYYLYYGRSFYSRVFHWYDFFHGLSYHLAVIPMGIISGLFFQKRIMRDRKSSILLTVLVVILSICSGFITFFKFLVFIVPPIYPMLKISGNGDYFNGIGVFASLVISVVYFSVTYSLYLFLLQKKKF
jgi:hypothetical protein